MLFPGLHAYRQSTTVDKAKRERRTTLRRSDRKPQTLPADAIPWEVVQRPERVVCIGDVHGDLEALACILYAQDLVDKKGDWCAAQTQLVLLGDLLGSEQSRLLVEFIIRITRQAYRSGGAVHAILGNHDLLIFHHAKSPKAERKGSRRWPVNGAPGTSLRDAFCHNTHLARWLRTRNAILKIGRTIFVHAGLNSWALRHAPDRVNATIRAWVRFWQAVDVRPPDETGWLVSALTGQPTLDSSAGPLWTRSFKPQRTGDGRQVIALPRTAPDRDMVERIVSTLHGKRMVVGHAPSAGCRILTAHPYYGNWVVMVDTRISDAKRGRLSCLEIVGDELTAHYSERKKRGKRIVKRERKRLQRLCEAEAIHAARRGAHA